MAGAGEFEFETMPVIDLQLYLQGAASNAAAAGGSDSSEVSEAAQAECKKVAECFHNFGIILIRDPRVNMQDNEQYIDLMESEYEDLL